MSVTHTEPAPAASSSAGTKTQFVQYLMLRVDPRWRRLEHSVRQQGGAEFTRAVCAANGVTTHVYSTLGLKVGADLLLWCKTDSPDPMQDFTGTLLHTGLGRYCDITHSLWGFTRPSVYTKQRTAQEHALDAPTRLRYLVVYPFSKTHEWYLMSREARQGMMNEHMRIGHDFDDVRQVLLYSTGLDDQEFVVAYETDDLERHHQLVVALRSTEARRYTLRDTPIFTAIHRSIDDAVSLVG